MNDIEGMSTQACGPSCSQQSTVSQKSSQGSAGVFVDAVTGRHVSTNANQILDKRKLAWSKEYGWT